MGEGFDGRSSRCANPVTPLSPRRLFRRSFEAVTRQNLKPRTPRARELRVNSSDAERKLWSVISNRRLEGYKFRRQHPIDRYFADFACVEAKLIVEIDGRQHIERAAYDAERTRVLEVCGWQVLRFWNNEVLQNLDGVGEAILAALRLPNA